MVNYLKTKKANFILAFLVFIMSYAQENSFTYYPEFEDFKKVGFYIAPVIYQKASIDRKTGEYQITNKNLTSISFGFDYVKEPTQEWSFRTGIRFDLVPFYHFSYFIPHIDLLDSEGIDIKHIKIKKISKINMTIPLVFEIKKQLGSMIFFTSYSGFNLMIMRDGGFGYDGYHTYSLGNFTQSIQVFDLNADAKNSTSVYPNFVISPGVYLVFNKFIIQLNFIYQRALVKYFQGEYQFANLKISKPTKGDYSVSGNYCAMGLTLFLKKKKRNHFKGKENSNLLLQN